MQYPPTDEQLSIISAVQSTKDNIMIRAYAGCGKTATLELIDKACSTRPKLYLAFNKSVAVKAAKEQRMHSTTTIRTFNSIGHRIWADTIGKQLDLDLKKILTIYQELTKEARPIDRKIMWDMYDLVADGVNKARAIGYIPPKHAMADRSLATTRQLELVMEETPLPEVMALIDKVLTISISAAFKGKVDFSDQIYMPAVFQSIYPNFPMVLVDEYQDLSPVNQELVRKICKNSRQIGVGDEAQAIYAFRGADAHGMERAIERFGMKVLNLSISFRCPSAITDNVQWRVPIKSSRKGGKVIYMDNAMPKDGDMVICRNNAPLTRLAMKCLMAHHSVDVSGIDIGGRIIKLLTKLGPEDMSQAQAMSAAREWLDERLSLDSKSAQDVYDCMVVFIRGAKTLSGAIAYAKHMFENTTGTIKFMTGHKAKGLEFQNVFHLNDDLLTEHGQDPNLRYVIDTRAQETLTYIKQNKDY